nr:FecR family protein [uncultured Arsenicibacter sp.]
MQPDITHELLARYRAGQCTPDERNALRSYFLQTDKSALEELMAKDWQQTDPATPLPEGVAEAIWEQIRQSIVAEATPVISISKRRSGWYMAAAAAAVFLVVAGSWWFLGQNTGSNALPVSESGIEAPKGWLIRNNESTAARQFTLPDGSALTLAPKSRIMYPEKFTGELRVVRLQGQAFFSVYHDASHPFVVQTPSILVRVLGTSFTVKAFTRQSTAEVSVKTGRVQVSPADGKTAMLLTPNQRITLTVANGHVIKSLVAKPEVVNPSAVINRFVFADTPVASVFDMLERAYGVTIRFDRQALANCTLNAELTDQPLFTKLDMICSSIGAAYSVEGTEIHVRGTGCETEK